MTTRACQCSAAAGISCAGRPQPVAKAVHAPLSHAPRPRGLAVPFLAPKTQHGDRRVACRSQSGGGLGDEQGMDVAVFRFTLGIPGFEDRLIPRVVGVIGLVLLGVNHILGAQPPPDAQARAEAVIAALSLLCILVPEIEVRLREALPGRGRQSMAESIAGATNGFALAPTLSEDVKKELAWSSASLIKNTNTCGVMLVEGGRVVMARGALPSTAYQPGKATQTLDALTERLERLGTQSDVQAALRTASQASSSSSSSSSPATVSLQGQVYLPDSSALSAAQLGPGGAVPQGVQSALVQALPGAKQPAYLLMYSERPRSLSDKERRWAAALANKLGPVLAGK